LYIRGRGRREYCHFKNGLYGFFIHEVEFVDNKFKISIKKQDISLPGVNQRIQKCAFIRAAQGTGDYDLIILDNQISKKNQDEPVAQFFLETFLGADLVLDSKTCTRIFKKETENWIRSKAKEGETSLEIVREFVNDAIRNEDEIDLDSFSSKVFSDKTDLKEDYISTMREKGLPVTGLKLIRMGGEKAWQNQAQN